MALALARTHRLYSGFVNARARRTGHVFYDRYGSVAMDEAHLLNALRYVALNPVRARLVAAARDWPHSSVAAHLVGRDDGITIVRPILDRVANFADLLATAADDPAFATLRRAKLIGRPLGSPDFVAAVEARLGRRLAPGKRRRKPKGGASSIDNRK